MSPKSGQHDAPKSLNELTATYKNLFESVGILFPSLTELRHFIIPRSTGSGGQAVTNTHCSMLAPHFAKVLMKFQNREMAPNAQVNFNGSSGQYKCRPRHNAYSEDMNTENIPERIVADGDGARNQLPESIEVRVNRRYKLCSDKNHELSDEEEEDDDTDGKISMVYGSRESETYFDGGPSDGFLFTEHPVGRTISYTTSGTLPPLFTLPRSQPIQTITLDDNEEGDDGDLNDLDVLIIDLTDEEKAEFQF